MDWYKIRQILLSKALILAYFFIGYLALIDYDSPTCTVNSVPIYSNNDLEYPSIQTFHISMNEHIRSFKIASDKKAFESADLTDYFVTCTYWVPLYIPKTPFLSLKYYYHHSSRAPPSVIL
jgi:hypothetical protein